MLIHPESKVRTSVPVHPGRTVKEPLLHAIVRDANLSVEEFIEVRAGGGPDGGELVSAAGTPRRQLSGPRDRRKQGSCRRVKEIRWKCACCHERGTTMTKTAHRSIQVVLLTLVTAALGMADVAHFGLIQITPLENARLTAYCDDASTTPCDITFLFVHISGRLLKQASMTIQPGTSGFLDLPAAQTGISGLVQINPCWKVTRGSALASLEVFDLLTLRTRILINWGDRSVPRSGDVDFGMAGITPFDTARLSAFCPNEATTPGAGPMACDVTFNFHDAQGRVIKQSRMTLQPGTSGFADLRWPEIGATARRVELDPCWTVAGGMAVGTFALIDNLTGLTIVQAYPADLASGAQ